MDTTLKQELCRQGDSSLEASAIRARAVRSLAKMSQKGLADALGVGKSAISNIEKARSYPSREFITFMYSEHRVEPNFLILGLYQTLPADVQDRLLSVLSDQATESAAVQQ